MNITEVSTPCNDDEWGMGEGYRITIENHEKRITLDFGDGDPEDSTLARNFNDVYSIPAALKMAYDAGKTGEGFIFSRELENEV